MNVSIDQSVERIPEVGEVYMVSGDTTGRIFMRVPDKQGSAILGFKREHYSVCLTDGLFYQKDPLALRIILVPRFNGAIFEPK